MPKKTNVKTDWVKIKPEEIEKKVVELGKKGTAPEKAWNPKSQTIRKKNNSNIKRKWNRD